MVIATAQIYWAKMVEEAIKARKLKELYKKLCGMLEDLVELVRGKLTKLQRMTMSALIVIEVCDLRRCRIVKFLRFSVY